MCDIVSNSSECGKMYSEMLAKKKIKYKESSHLLINSLFVIHHS